MVLALLTRVFRALCGLLVDHVYGKINRLPTEGICDIVDAGICICVNLGFRPLYTVLSLTGSGIEYTWYAVYDASRR